MKLYGSLINRLSENQNYGDEIKVGTYATEYLWSDRNAHEVIEVINQNHLKIRRLRAIRTDDNGMSECQDYRFESDTNGYVQELKRRKNGGWNVVRTYVDADGKKHTRAVEKINISFGVADEYYDFSF